MRRQLPFKYSCGLENLLILASRTLHDQRGIGHSFVVEECMKRGMTRIEYHNASEIISRLHQEGYEVGRFIDRICDLYPRWKTYYDARRNMVHVEDYIKK